MQLASSRAQARRGGSSTCGISCGVRHSGIQPSGCIQFRQVFASPSSLPPAYPRRRSPMVG
jgi:hypothetical protein